MALIIQLSIIKILNINFIIDVRMHSFSVGRKCTGTKGSSLPHQPPGEFWWPGSRPGDGHTGRGDTAHIGATPGQGWRLPT